jgi:hypothetical protein
VGDLTCVASEREENRGRNECVWSVSASTDDKHRGVVAFFPKKLCSDHLIIPFFRSSIAGSPLCPLLALSAAKGCADLGRRTRDNTCIIYLRSVFHLIQSQLLNVLGQYNYSHLIDMSLEDSSLQYQ